MKRYISILIALLLAVSGLSACGSGKRAEDNDGEKLKIVATIFPEYDWVMNILGDKSDDVDVTLLLDDGVDPHSFQPTAEDIAKVSGCDVFIYVGGESDAWAEDALKEAADKSMTVVNLLEALGDRAKVEEHDDDTEHEDDGPEYDEHVWLSLRNASVLVRTIELALEKADGDNADVYRANADAYIEKINELDSEYEAAASQAKAKTLVFADRFPLIYLTDDYGIAYYAAFDGCSAETEASFETVTSLAKKVDELPLTAVVTIEGKDHRVAETVVQSTSSKDQKILTMDSMQSTTREDVENGTTYLSVMKSNLTVLKEALGEEA